jgi:mono/diheme cytochrome c family protein
MVFRQLFTTLTVLTVIVVAAPRINATLPPEVRKELSELVKELKDVNSHVRKKEVDQAKAIIQKIEDRIKELAIAENEKDRAYATFKTQLEKAKSLIPVSFEHEVAPILNESCVRCHGADQASANLRMDTFNGLAKGGRSGVPVAPGVPGRSGIMLRIASPNDQDRMPKGGAKLADADMMTIARWIEQGARFDGQDMNAPIGDTAMEKPEPPKPVTVVMADGSETVSFKDDVAPWLVNVCMGCHSGNNPAGKYRFTTFEQLLQGGPTGSTIVPGKPDESYIVDLVLRQEPRELKMPRGQAQLKMSQALALEKWIAEGAHFDGKDGKAPLRDIVPTEAQLEAVKLAKMSDSEFAERRITETAAIWKQVSPRTEGNTATSENFYFYGTASEDRLKQLSESAETHLGVLEKSYPLPEGQAAFRGRLTVFVTKDRFDYEEFNTVLMNRRTPKSVSGHSVINENFATAYIAMHDVGDTESAGSLTTSQMLNSLLGQSYLTRDGAALPDWLKQGFGILESGLELDSEYLKGLPSRAAKAVSTIADPGKLFDDGTLAPDEVGDVGYLLVRFLQSQGGPAKFQSLVGTLRRNPNAARAVEDVYGAPAAQLGKLFLQSSGK